LVHRSLAWCWLSDSSDVGGRAASHALSGYRCCDFPGLGIFARSQENPQGYSLYAGSVSIFGRILFGYGQPMIEIIRFKLSRNPDFRRE
jgi:hypothetical protein